MKTCGCGHVIDSDGFCLIIDDEEGPDYGQVHRVPRTGNCCVDCGKDVNP